MLKRILQVTLVGLCLLGGGTFAFMATGPATGMAAGQTDEDAMTEQVQAGFPDAPEEVRAVAAVIIAGGVPDMAALQALGPEMLNRSWSATGTRGRPMDGHGLLRQAVLSLNPAAAEALVAAGADVRFNEGEMPYLAVSTVSADKDLWFPDFSDGNRMLRLWLQAGGDPNAAWPGDSIGPGLHMVPEQNLEAVLILLAAGANPWFEPPFPGADPDDPIRSASYFEKLANASPIANEIAFRIAREGHYRGGPREVVDKVMDRYERTAGLYVGSTGPENLHLIWAMQKALALIVEQTDTRPGPHVAALLDTQVREGIGGFFLAAGELHSPRDDDQLLRSDNQTGSELWHDDK